MPTCPKCGAEIYELIFIGVRPQKYVVYIAGEWLWFEPVEQAEDFLNGEYCCPECNEVLFRSESDAEEFLKKGIPGVVLRKISGGQDGEM